MKEAKNIAIVGATGLVGKTFLELLESDHFVNSNIHLVASKKSEGKKITFRNLEHQVNLLESFDFSKVELAFFSAGSEVAKEYAPLAAEKGCLVIDNSSCFRRNKDIPLIIPEVNSGVLHGFPDNGIIANPNCSTIQMLVALKPLHDLYKVNRIDVTTFQAVSGTGKLAQEELLKQSEQELKGEKIPISVYTKKIAFNALPHCDDFQENSYTFEEMKMVWETHKILDNNIEVTATCVRVPVLNGHSESIHLETDKKINLASVREVLNNTKGVRLVSGERQESYLTAAEIDGKDSVYIGRLRMDLWSKNRLNLWVVADNLRKGAALNSIQIAELLFS